jgi:L-ascorbate metabolism protein UlaG (beta-lactamase superfamily)
VRLRLLRHATLLVDTGGRRFLVDPMLGPAGGQPPVPETPNPRPNPLVELPVQPAEALAGVEAVLLTHLHSDHVDGAALAVLPRGLPVLCQPNDAPMIARQGFSDLRPLTDGAALGDVSVSRTGGRHGHGALATEMGPVSGFVLAAEGEPTLYIAGDTVWCEEVEAAIAAHEPHVIVVNAGGARFIAGEPITMGVEDVALVCRAAPDALVVAVHMEAVNHCVVGREDLRRGLATEGLDGRVAIPADGETLEISFD